MSFTNKRSLNQANQSSRNLEEAECLIIPGINGEDIMLIPCGNIDGCTLYLESHDQVPQEDGMQGRDQHSGGSKGLGACRGV